MTFGAKTFENFALKRIEASSRLTFGLSVMNSEISVFWASFN